MTRSSFKGISLAETLVVAGLVVIVGNLLTLALNFFFLQTARWDNQRVARLVALENLEVLRKEAFSKPLDEIEMTRVKREERVYKVLTTVSSVPGLDSDRIREIKVRCEWEGRRKGFYEKRARLTPSQTSAPPQSNSGEGEA